MTTYYVDPNVAGPGNGTFGDPWDDIGSNINGLSAGDTLMLRTGTYDESEISVTVNGTEANPITIRPYGSENVVMNASTPGDYVWEFKSDWIVLDGQQTSQLDIDKNDVTGGAIYFNGGEHCTVRNAEIHNARWIGAIVRVRGHYNTIEDCEIHHNYNGPSTDAAGVSIQDGVGHKVLDCTIYDVTGDCIIVDDAAAGPTVWEIDGCTLYTTLGKCSENGIDVKYNATDWAYITNCHFHGFRTCDNTCGGTGNNKGEALGIRNSATKVIVQNCTITDSTTAIVCDDWVDDIILRDIKIYELHENDPNADSMSGLWLRASGVDAYNITFYDCPEISVYVWENTSGCTITNCIFEDCGTIEGEGEAGVTWSYNAWYNCTETKSGTGDVTSDPQMGDPANQDFTLDSGSPCIDAGTDVGWTFYGSAPDMGAEEYPPELTLDAQIVLAQSDALTADATIKQVGTSGSFAVNATIEATQTDTLTSDAAIERSRTGTATLDAIIQRVAQSAGVTADAVIEAAQSAGITIDAVINASDVAANLIANAVIKAAQTGAFTTDARIQPSTVSDTFTSDAAILRSRSGSATLDACVLRARTGTFTIGATIEAAQSGAATLDAAILAAQSGAVTADAVTLRARTGTATLDAVVKGPRYDNVSPVAATIKAPQMAGATADAVILRSYAGAVVLDGAIKASVSGSMTLDAVALRARTGTLALDATVSAVQTGSVTLGAYVYAYVDSEGPPIRTTPALIPRQERAKEL